MGKGQDNKIADSVAGEFRGGQFAINDVTFCAYATRLKNLHNFLYQEAVPLNPSYVFGLEMGNLDALYYEEDGRQPTIEEWNQVNK